MRKVLYILGELRDTDIEWIIGNGQRVNVDADTVLIREGTPIDALYIVLDGQFSVSIGDTAYTEIARIGAGEVLGEMSFVDRHPPAATVIAREPSMVLAIPRDRLFSKLKQDDGFAAHFYRALAVFLSDRLRGTVSRLGYDKDVRLEEDVEYEDELDMNVLDNVSMAGARFEHILRSMRGG
jgi:bacteriocin-type transport-associated protein